MKSKLFLTTIMLLFATLVFAHPVDKPAEFTLDKAHSYVGFTVQHMVITKVRGEFKDYEATIVYDESDISNSSINVKIDVASINTDNEKRDNHLKSGDFFLAEDYPHITFESAKIEKDGDQYLAHGKLTIRGVTKDVTMPFSMTEKITDPWGNIKFGAEASLKINRFDFGVSWDNALDTGALVVGKEVTIDIQAQAIKKKA